MKPSTLKKVRTNIQDKKYQNILIDIFSNNLNLFKKIINFKFYVSCLVSSFPSSPINCG